MRNALIFLGLLTVAACGGEPQDTDTQPAATCKSGGEGLICTVAGIAGTQQFGAEGIAATESPLNLPVDIAVSPAGDLYIADFNNHRVRLVDSAGIVNTVTGTGMLGDGVVDELGAAQPGPALEAAWNHPTNIAFAPGDSSNLWVAAWHNSRINRVALDESWVYFECGDGTRSYGGDGGDASVAQLDLPSGVAFDEAGNLYISDQANQIVRMVDADGVITTIAGTAKLAGYAGDGGPASAALFHGLVGQAADPSNRLAYHDGKLYLADTRNQLVRVIDLATMTIDRFAGTFVDNGETDPALSGGVTGFSGDGGDALLAQLNMPRDVAVGPNGEIYIADTDNHCVRVVTDGIIETFAGTCGVVGNDAHGVAPTEALLDKPYGIAVGLDGEVYIADMNNHAIRVVR